MVAIRPQSDSPFLDPGQVLEGVAQFTVSAKRGHFCASQTGGGLAPDEGAKKERHHLTTIDEGIKEPERT